MVSALGLAHLPSIHTRHTEVDEPRYRRPLAALEAVADTGELENGNEFIDDIAPGIVLPAGDYVVLRVDVAPDRALNVC